MERAIKTKEYTEKDGKPVAGTYDLQLTSVNDSAGDYIIIRRGRAKLYINKDTNPKPFAVGG